MSPGKKEGPFAKRLNVERVEELVERRLLYVFARGRSLITGAAAHQ
jgi:hypothetical protein